jgi:hypothetical protein
LRVKNLVEVFSAHSATFPPCAKCHSNMEYTARMLIKIPRKL